MINSTLQIYSLFSNCRNLFIHGKKVRDINKLYTQFAYVRTNEYLKKVYAEIFNAIENGFYTYDDLICYVLLNYLFFDNIDFKDCKEKFIKGSSFILSDIRYNQDLEILNEVISNNKNIDDFSKLFESNDLGTSYIYELINEGVISPVVFLKNLNIYEKKKDLDKEKQVYSNFVKKIYYIRHIY